jgi:hypothetical protein
MHLIGIRIRRRRRIAGMTTAAVVALVISAAVAVAHVPIPPTAEVWSGAARLFVADNGTDSVLAVDLPDGSVSARISVPAHTMMLGVSPDRSTVLAIRGRDTDRQLVTFIDAGVDSDGMRLPYVARTLDLGMSMNGIEGGELEQLWGRNVLISESKATAYLFTNRSLEPARAFATTEIPLTYPDHVHVLEQGRNAWVAYLAKGVVRLIDRLGKERAKVACPIAHGAARDAATGLGVFACQTDLVLVDGNAQVARIAYPGGERIGGFLETSAGLVGYSESVTGLQKVNAASRTITRIDLGGELYRAAVTEDGAHVLALLASGQLQVRSATTLALERTIAVTQAFPPLDETTSAAIMPAIVTSGATAFVSLPNRGLVAEVNWGAGTVTRTLRVGGMPTRMILVSR